MLNWLSSLFYKSPISRDTRDTRDGRVETIIEEVQCPTESKRLRPWVYKTVDLANRGLVEFTACMMFHFIGSVSPTPWANGIALMVLVYYTAKISGAHLNPAISLTFCLLGHTTPSESLIYAACQTLGCAAGALWIAALVPGIDVRSWPVGPFSGLSGCFVPLESLTHFQIYAWEAVCTTCFIVPIFSVVWYTQQKKGYGNTGPLIVGLSLIANALACGQFTGASLNPARSLGSYIVFPCPYKHVWTYVLGEFTGAIVATFAIVPWYGISKTAWYAYKVPKWAFEMAAGNQKTIIIETLSEVDKRPVGSRKSLDSRISSV
jgi:glycerol uptake facilitator-like aquaporin